MPTIEIEFEGSQRILYELQCALFESAVISAHMKKAIPGVGDIALNQWPLGKSDGGSGMFSVLLNIGEGVSASLAAAWIFKNLQGRPTIKIRIERKELKIGSDGSIRQIEEAIEIERRD